MKVKKKKSNITKFSIILLSFLLIILFGSFLLWLPISQTGEGLSYIDSLFLSTSAICVTGLSPVSDLSQHLSMFGRIVLAILIEIGGLGIVSLVMFIAIIFGFKITINQRFLLKEALNQDAAGGIVQMLKKIVLTAISIQFIGFVLNFISLYWIEGFDFAESIGFSIFHSISSFNNAGFDLFGDSSLINFSDNVLFNFSTCLMIFCGGLGFIVIFDILQKRKFRKLSLHSKIVLVTTLSLLVCGTLLFKFLNYDSLTWLEAIFLSFTVRTAGFTSINLNNLGTASKMISMILMFIGVGPASTGGGIKVSTFFVMLLSFRAFAKSDNETHAFNRKISDSLVTKAFVLSIFALSFIFISTTTILAIEKERFTFLQTSFEVVSAFSTTGLTLGITTKFTTFSKIIICLIMYIGRLGPITFISLFQKNQKVINKDSIRFVEESVIIG